MSSSPPPHPASRPSTPPQSNVVHQISSPQPSNPPALATQSKPSVSRWLFRLLAWLSNFQTCLSNSRAWLSKNTVAVTGWAIAIPGLIFAAISLGPGFESQNLSKQALELAQWTALKDYIEQCQSAADSGVITSECGEALASTLPPPPHVNFESPDTDRSLIPRAFPKLFNGLETHLPSAIQGGPLAPPHIIVMVLLLVLSSISVLVYLRFLILEGTRKSLNRTDEETVFVDLPYDTPRSNFFKQPKIIRSIDPLPIEEAEEPVGISTNFEAALIEDDGRLRRRKNTTLIPISESEGDKCFACPFLKLNPFKHRYCFRFRLKGRGDVCLHLLRVHAQSRYSCPKCYVSFEGLSDLNIHTGIDTCEQASGPEDLSQEEQEMLRDFRGIRGQPNTEYWYEIWDALFKAHPRPSSPYTLGEVGDFIECLSHNDLWDSLPVRLRSFNLDIDTDTSFILRACIVDMVFGRINTQKSRHI